MDLILLAALRVHLSHNGFNDLKF